MNTPVMLEYLETLPQLPATEKALLVMDGYANHYATEVVKRAREKGFIIFIIPPNRSGRLNIGDQSGCNLKVRKSLKDLWSSWAGPLLVKLEEGEKLAPPRRPQVCQWLRDAYRSVSDENVCSAFRAALWPSALCQKNMDVTELRNTPCVRYHPSQDVLDLRESVHDCVVQISQDDFEILSDIEDKKVGDRWGFTRIVSGPQYEGRGQRRQLIPGPNMEYVEFRKVA
eukprot:TRINITY_DN1334_c1_g1_i1.p1 TRINITY_DN1334_c1_g1~~TRINITY_DN1334_c1_g1_i1.p1  ORF type:complete len:227 (-),score=8.99 TRINITY_DN1334_c1_g1_i1:171-851(-)